MRILTLFVSLLLKVSVHGQSWTTSKNLQPWESHLQLGFIARPLGLALNYTSLAHHHFQIGYSALHAFMYQQADDAFNLALNTTPTFIEAYLGKLLACKHPFLSEIDFDCASKLSSKLQTMLKTSNQSLNELQSALFTSINEWYANRTSTEAGERLFLISMARLVNKHKNQTDIMVWWALSMLNVAYQRVIDREVEPEMIVEARDILKTVLLYEPNHPGALRLLIHSYDVSPPEIAEKASDYARAYGKMIVSSSGGHHASANIWLRTGAWLLALEAEEAAIRASLTFCASRLFEREIPVRNEGLDTFLEQINRTSQLLQFYQCDIENRARASEWLSYTRLQVGDWSGAVSALRDLYTADDQSLMTPNEYLPFAYRTEARAVIELFYWFPYSDDFLNKVNELSKLHVGKPFALLSDNTTEWEWIWSEAAYRYADCLVLINKIEMGDNSSTLKQDIDEHIIQLAILSNRTSKINKYASNSILMMIPQLHALRYFVNHSWQECLHEFSEAIRIESTLFSDRRAPFLAFARSSELLATHLLLIFDKFQETTANLNTTSLTFNRSSIVVNNFPWIALDLYQKSDQLFPNRAANTLGMARAHADLDQRNVAVTLYQQLLFQMNSANKSEPSFLSEIHDFLDEPNFAITNCFSILLLSCSIFFTILK